MYDGLTQEEMEALLSGMRDLDQERTSDEEAVLDSVEEFSQINDAKDESESYEEESKETRELNTDMFSSERKNASSGAHIEVTTLDKFLKENNLTLQSSDDVDQNFNYDLKHPRDEKEDRDHGEDENVKAQELTSKGEKPFVAKSALSRVISGVPQRVVNLFGQKNKRRQEDAHKTEREEIKEHDDKSNIVASLDRLINAVPKNINMYPVYNKRHDDEDEEVDIQDRSSKVNRAVDSFQKKGPEEPKNFAVNAGSRVSQERAAARSGDGFSTDYSQRFSNTKVEPREEENNSYFADGSSDTLGDPWKGYSPVETANILSTTDEEVNRLAFSDEFDYNDVLGDKEVPDKTSENDYQNSNEPDESFEFDELSNEFTAGGYEATERVEDGSYPAYDDYENETESELIYDNSKDDLSEYLEEEAQVLEYSNEDVDTAVEIDLNTIEEKEKKSKKAKKTKSQKKQKLNIKEKKIFKITYRGRIVFVPRLFINDLKRAYYARKLAKAGEAVRNEVKDSRELHYKRIEKVRLKLCRRQKITSAKALLWRCSLDLLIKLKNNIQKGYGRLYFYLLERKRLKQRQKDLKKAIKLRELERINLRKRKIDDVVRAMNYDQENRLKVQKALLDAMINNNASKSKKNSKPEFVKNDYDNGEQDLRTEVKQRRLVC